MASEKEKMLRGDLYDPYDPELAAEHRRARELLQTLNATYPGDRAASLRLIEQLLGSAGDGAWIEPPFFCDYGSNIHLGVGVYFNVNCVVLDTARVEIGDHTLIGPNVQIYTPVHPMNYLERRTGLELAQPVEIGADVWIGGGAIICPGVRVGSRSVIGAGSVVVADVPADVFAAGNPCQAIRELS
jgi:maltose O-acetyltransferase